MANELYMNPSVQRSRYDPCLLCRAGGNEVDFPDWSSLVLTHASSMPPEMIQSGVTTSGGINQEKKDEHALRLPRSIPLGVVCFNHSRNYRGTL